MYDLKDTNPHYHNCGHYPEWTVVEALSGPYDTREEAEARAMKLNEKSSQRWRDFLNS